MRIPPQIGLLVACAALAASTTPGTPAGPTLLDTGYRQMYNMQFAAAHQTFSQWEAAHPDDPMGPVSDAAAYLFSEFDRLRVLQTELFVDNRSFFGMRKVSADPAVKQHFDAALAKTQALVTAALSRSPEDADARFADVLRLGLHADYLALIDKKYMASLGEMKTGRTLAEKLVSQHPEYYDAQLATGVENYLLSQKPALVRSLLRMAGAQTDKSVGLAKLRLTAEKGRYLMPYARMLLAVADLRDGQTASARRRLQWLATEFPENRLYREQLSKLPGERSTP